MKMHYPGNALARYRDQTEVKGSNMNGVMAPSFRCVACEQSRLTRGRKKVAQGWICADCQGKEAA